MCNIVTFFSLFLTLPASIKYVWLFHLGSCVSQFLDVFDVIVTNKNTFTPGLLLCGHMKTVLRNYCYSKIIINFQLFLTLVAPMK